MNAILFDPPMEICRITSIDPSILTFSVIAPFLQDLRSLLQTSASGRTEFSPPVSTLISGRINFGYAGINWSCEVEIVPADIGPTRAVSLRLSAAGPGADQSSDVCTPANFAFMWRWACPVLRQACTSAAKVLPRAVIVQPCGEGAAP